MRNSFFFFGFWLTEGAFTPLQHCGNDTATTGSAPQVG